MSGVVVAVGGGVGEQEGGGRVVIGVEKMLATTAAQHKPDV